MPLRFAAPLTAIVLAAVLLAGCGDSSTETDGTRIGTITGEVPIPAPDQAPIGASAQSCASHSTDTESLRATGLPCDRARQVMDAWQRERTCSVPDDTSRDSCLTGSYRCQATRADRGLSVSCARQGQSIAFVARP